ncbi:MAG TPA: ABC transporter permease [Kofleriaceae bacterium]|nr:ABC transporter permease [Kofleriaceae bacterium]
MKALRDTFVIARRELLERVRSKWFIVMTLIGPIGMVAMVIVPALIASSSTRGTKVEIVDRSGKLGPALVLALTENEWKATVVDPTTPDAVELQRIKDNQINGYISVPPDALAEGEIIYRGDNASSAAVKIDLTKAVAKVVIAARALELKLTPQQIAGMGQKINFEAKHTTGDTEASGTGAFFIAYILAFILYMVITLYGVTVMRSVVQEKTSRVMEFLVAAVKPSSLMSGKILGVGAAGLIQIAVWLGMGAITLAYRNTILGWFGVTGGDAALPPLELAEITIVLVYFVLGFFFYSAMYAAVGAMVSSEQDTQQVQMPVTMLLVIGVLCLQVVSNAPRGSSATIMTNIPLWSPMLMPMRYVLGGATLGEVFISLAILIGSLLLVVRAAAKIYRVGVLMYGKRPGVRELIRWLRY